MRYYGRRSFTVILKDMRYPSSQRHPLYSSKGYVSIRPRSHEEYFPFLMCVFTSLHLFIRPLRKDRIKIRGAYFDF